jgi:pimeloyl-ACP methyl ester carboxylesterase
LLYSAPNVTKEEQLASIWTEVNGLRMHARATPIPAERQPIVLVHGLVVSSRYMIPTATGLARYCRVYAPDLPGFGRSEHPARPLDIRALADALAGWMRAAGIERASLVGNSMGCQVIADLALRYSAMAERLVLVGPTMDRYGRNLLEQVRRLLAASPYESPTLVGVQMRDIWSAGIRETVATTHYALEDRLEAKLPHITAPALVIRGARDPIAPARWCEEVARLLPRGQLCTVPGGHALNYSYPDRLIAAMAPFLGLGHQSSRAT